VRLRSRVDYFILERERIILEKKNLEDDRSSLRREREVLLKQRNIFCNVAKRLYSQLNKFLNSSAIS